MTRVLLALLATAALAAAAGLLGARAAPDPPGREGDVYRMRRGDLLYRFHATFRVESLFDAAADPHETRDLAAARPADLERLRAEFLRRLRLKDLDAVPVTAEEWRKAAEGLGYLGGGGDR